MNKYVWITSKAKILPFLAIAKHGCGYGIVVSSVTNVARNEWDIDLYQSEGWFSIEFGEEAPSRHGSES